MLRRARPTVLSRKQVNYKIGEDTPMLLACQSARAIGIMEMLSSAGAQSVASCKAQNLSAKVNANFAMASGDKAGKQQGKAAQGSRASGSSGRLTPLVLAAGAGDVNALQDLLRAGANANEMRGMPLLVAAQEGRLEAAQLLMRAGAKADQTNGRGASPLYAACANKHADVAAALVQAGADVHRRCNDGITVMGAAVAGGSKEVVDLLLAAGAKADKFDDGSSALAVAAQASRGQNKARNKHDGLHA